MGVFDNDPNRPIEVIMEDLRQAASFFDQKPSLVAITGSALLVRLAQEAGNAVSGLNQSVRNLQDRITELDDKNGKLQRSVYLLTWATAALTLVQAVAAVAPFFHATPPGVASNTSTTATVRNGPPSTRPVGIQPTATQPSRITPERKPAPPQPAASPHN